MIPGWLPNFQTCYSNYIEDCYCYCYMMKNLGFMVLDLLLLKSLPAGAETIDRYIIKCCGRPKRLLENQNVL